MTALALLETDCVALDGGYQILEFTHCMYCFNMEDVCVDDSEFDSNVHLFIKACFLQDKKKNIKKFMHDENKHFHDQNFESKSESDGYYHHCNEVIIILT